MNRPVLVAVAGLAVLGMTAAGAYVIASPGGEEEAVQQVETATPSIASTAPSPTVPLESPLPSASPSIPGDLPPPAEGYTWFATPDDWAVLAPFAVQVPIGWVRTVDANFVPEGTPSNFPYPQIPQLMVLVGRIEPNPPDSNPAWQHPFVWMVGRQGGGGCEGDVSSGSVTPSSTYAAALRDWEIYVFTCHVETTTDPPGVVYAGRAAEARLGDLVFTVVTLEPPGSGLTAQVFEQSIDTFRER